MGQQWSTTAGSCKAVEGCCRQHVLPDRVSDTVKVDISLLHISPPFAGSSTGNKENTQPQPHIPPGAVAQRSSSRNVESSQTQPSSKPQSVSQATPVFPTPASYRSWEAGWLGSPAPNEFADLRCCKKSNGLSGEWAEVDGRLIREATRSTSQVDSAPWLAQLAFQGPATHAADHKEANQIPQKSDGAIQTDSRFAEEVAQFSLPDENTPVLTGLLVPAPPAEVQKASIEHALRAPKDTPTWAWGANTIKSPRYDQGEQGCAPVPTTPTTCAGHSTPSGSPATYRLGSPVLSIRSEATDSRNVSPACRGSCQSPLETQEARMQEAQSLFNRMLTPTRAGAGRSRRSSEPPLPPGAPSPARGGTPAKQKVQLQRPYVSSAELENAEEEVPLAEAPKLQPLNGRLPHFPSAELNPIQQVKSASRRRNRLPVKARAAG
jgi:hypothetical protein